MKKIIFCSIAVLAVAVFSVKAQESKKDTACFSDTVSFQAKCDSLAKLNIALSNQLDSLKMILVMREEMLVKQDSIISIHEDRMNFVDTCMMKLCNRWLFEKYNKEAVDDAIKYFNRIISPQLKETYSVVLNLLSEYEKSYFTFQKIMKSAQSDSRRYLETRREEYATYYIGEIQNMEYYKKYYHRNWNIRYLTNQIKSALEMLEKHKSTDKTADFSSFIDIKKEEVSIGNIIGESEIISKNNPKK